MREAETLRSVAWNHLDYSDPDLIAAWGYDTVMDQFIRFAELRFSPHYYGPGAERYSALLDWGPDPIVPYDVEETDEGAIVTACVVGGRTLVDGDIRWVQVDQYTIREVAGGTEITFEGVSDWGDQPEFEGCRVENVEEAEFVPAPEWPEAPEDGIKYPADRKVYEELQSGDK